MSKNQDGRVDNHRAVFDFVEYWRESEGFVEAPTGNCTFPATIRYEFDERTVNEETDVSIIRNGFSEGKVSLREKGDLVAERFHLDFKIDFQQYRHLVGDHSLVIEGESKKMRGAYRVTILPIG